MTGAAALVGRRLAQYRVKRLIAEGGMGAVYEAFHEGLQRPVALKTLTPRGETGEDVRRFVTEARVLARLDHPNIVPVLDVGESGGVRYLAMELVRGQSLYDLIRSSGTLDEDTALDFVRQAALGLQHAHDMGVLHRDLKPANLLLQGDGSARLTDFGVAKVAGNARLTATGTALGTPNYMSPEQAMGKNSDLDVRSDVYGLGAILYECLTGMPPFNKASAVDTMNAVVREPVVSPRVHNPGISLAAETICLRCLGKRPEDRYSSARHLADEIDRLEQGLAPVVEDREESLGWRGPAGVVGGMLAIAAVALGILAIVRPPSRSSEVARAETGAERARALLQGAAEGDGGLADLVEAARLDPAGAAGRAAALRVAKALRVRDDPGADLLAVTALQEVARQTDDLGREARAELAETRAKDLDWSGALELLEGAGGLEGASGERARLLREICGALAPVASLPRHRVALAARDAEGPLLVLVQGQACSVHRLVPGEEGLGAPLRQLGVGTRRLRHVAVGDWNRDGVDELFLVSEEGGFTYLQVLCVSGAEAPVDVAVPIPGFQVKDVAGGDVDGDGNADFAVDYWEKGNQSVVLMGGNEARPQSVYPRSASDPPFEKAFSCFALADFDGDGNDELFVGPSGAGDNMLDVRSLAADGSGFTSLGEVATGPVRAMIPYQAGDGKQRVLVVVDLDERDPAVSGGSPWLGRDGLLVVGERGGAPAVLGWWVLHGDRGASRDVVGWVQDLRGTPWVGRAYRDARSGERVLELAPLSALSGESNAEAAWGVRRADSRERLGALVADLDGDGDQELLLGRRLFGSGEARAAARAPQGGSSQGSERNMVLAARRLGALGLSEEAEAARGRIREAAPGGLALLELQEVDDELRRAEACEQRGELALWAGNAEAGSSLLEKARESYVRAAERCERLALSAETSPEDRAAAWSKAGFSLARAREYARAHRALQQALGSQTLGPQLRAHLAGESARFARYRDLRGVDIDFAAELSERRLGVMRPLRTEVREGGLRLRCDGGALDAALVPLSGCSRLPIELEAELSMEGGAWESSLQIGVFEADPSGAFRHFTGLQFELSSPEVGVASVRVSLGGRLLAQRVRLSPRGDLVLSLSLLPAASGGVEGTLKVSGGDGGLLAQVRFTDPDGALGDLRSAYAGAVSPLASNPRTACVEPAGWPMATWVTLRRLRVRGQEPGLQPMPGLWAGHAALAGGRPEDALRIYQSFLSKPSPFAQDALWARGFARARRGDPNGYQDLVTLARQNPYYALLRFEDLAEGHFAGKPSDLVTLGRTLAALSQGGPLLRALVLSLRGEYGAAAGLDPGSMAGSRRAAAAYLRMRDLTDPRGRWQVLGGYQQVVGAQGRLPRTRFPQLLDLRAEALDESTYTNLLQRSEDPFAHVRQLQRALMGRPQAVLPRIHLAERYTEAGLFGMAEDALQRALRCSPSPEERGVIFLGLAQARLGMDLPQEALRALGEARAAGVEGTRLKEFAPALGREPGFQELLAR